MKQHKKVEFVELFYDLVFVYAISQITDLIHHLHDGTVSTVSFLAFAISLILYINTWMVQTVFINRFGINNFRNIGFLFVQMLFLLITSQTLTNDWKENFVFNMWPLVMISFILLIQYSVQYMYSSDKEEQRWIRPYFVILGLRTIGLFIALCFPYSIGLIIANITIIATWILPGILNRYFAVDTRQAFDFPHLVERLSLLVIIMFGEMIIGILPYFKNGFSWQGLLAFFFIAHLFLVYIVEFDHLIDINNLNYSVLGSIYWHYSIFAGLSLVTVSLGFIEEVANLFSINMLYLGLIMILVGILFQTSYNKPELKFALHVKVKIFLLILSGYLISLFCIGNAMLILFVVFIIVTALAFYFIAFHLLIERKKCHKK